MTQPPPNWQPQGAQPSQGPAPQSPVPPGAQPSAGPAPQGYPSDGQGQTQTQKKSKTPIILAGVLALAIVVGGAIFAFTHFTKGGATGSIAKSYPTNAAFLMELNLNPSADQQQAMSTWVERLPLLSDKIDASSYKESVTKWAGLHTATSWMGDSIAFGGVPNANGELVPVSAFTVTNKDKAEQFFQEDSPSLKRKFVGDTLLVWDESYDLEIDTDAVAKDPLANSQSYQSLMGKLPSANLGTVFINQGFTKYLPEVSEGLRLNGVDTSLITVEDFTLAGALTATNDVITMKMVGTQSQPVTPGQDVSASLGEMDADSLGALGISYSDEGIDKIWQALQKVAASSSGSDLLSAFGLTSASNLKDLLGNQMALTLNELSSSISNQMPEIGVMTKGGDPDRLEQLINFLSTAAEGLTVTKDGDTAYLGIGVKSDEVKSPSTKLKDLEAYRKATEGSAQAALWFNLAKIRESELSRGFSDSDAAMISRLSGMGLVASSEASGDFSLTLRIVAEK